jgi:hypothetical protein
MHAQAIEKPGKAISDRQRYLEGRLKHSAWLFTLDNGRAPGISQGKRADDRYVQIGGRFNEPGKTVYDLTIVFTSETWREAEKVLVSVGDSSGALYAQITPDAATMALRAFFGVASGRAPYPGRPEDVQEAAKLSAALKALGRQLPSPGVPLTDFAYLTPDHPAQPRELGWINYWSADTCSYLGFPQPDRDSDLLVHSQQTPAGAWLVKLSSEPLDLTRADDLRILADTYARFTKLQLWRRHGSRVNS